MFLFYYWIKSKLDTQHYRKKAKANPQHAKNLKIKIITKMLKAAIEKSWTFTNENTRKEKCLWWRVVSRLRQQWEEGFTSWKTPSPSANHIINTRTRKYNPAYFNCDFASTEVKAYTICFSNFAANIEK